MKRGTLGKIFLAAGAVLLALGVLVGERVLSDAMGGMLVGVGSGLLAMGAVQLLMRRYDVKHPQQARQSEIEQRDERNVAMWPSAAGPRWSPARSFSGASWRRHGCPWDWGRPCG